MPDITMIAAVDSNWAIGCKGDVLLKLPEDRRHFKQLTLGSVIIIGRKTLESFPGGKPLPGRTNIVITGNKKYTARGVILAYSIEDALKKAEAISKADGKKIFVAGGGEIYRQMKDYCSEAVITYFDCKFEEADTYFPDLDKDDGWRLDAVSEKYSCDSCEFEFRTYKKK